MLRLICTTKQHMATTKLCVFRWGLVNGREMIYSFLKILPAKTASASGASLSGELVAKGVSGSPCEGLPEGATTRHPHSSAQVCVLPFRVLCSLVGVLIICCQQHNNGARSRIFH